MTRRIGAWAVHLFTATGAVFGLLALQAASRDDWQFALAWMAVAMAIDSLDGTLARVVDVRGALPNFDGELLDNIVDYLNYVFVPAFILLRAGIVPAGTALPAAAAVLLSSAHQFSQGDAKTDDHFFKGFPSFWNVAVLYMLALRVDPRVNLALVVVLAIGVFIPIRWAYPSRMSRLRGLTLALTGAWGLSVAAMLWVWPAPPRWLVACSMSYLAYYMAVSGFLSMMPSGQAAVADRAGR